MNIETLSQRWMRARSTNTTQSGSFVSRLPTFTVPSGIGDAAAQTTSAVFPLNPILGGGKVPNLVKVKPFGAGSNNNTLSVRIIGWRQVMASRGSGLEVWDPTVLVECACTLSSTPIGLAGGIIADTDLFADTITLTYPTAAPSGFSVHSNAADLAAFFVVDLYGCELLELSFDRGGSATNANALVALL